LKTFEDIWPLMRALWPHADLGEGHELRNLYRERLGKCRPELLEQAIKDVRTNYSSRTPELKWILDRYRALFREWKSNQAPVNEGPTVDEEEKLQKEVMKDRERIAFNLSLLTGEELAMLRKEVARRAFLRSLAVRVHGPPESWTPFTQGMVWALHSSLSSEPNQDRSQGPRLLE